jgi:ribosomal peptide maturation radical SAM protein 1
MATSPGLPPKLRIALAAMPWPAFNRPSVQLGALKAYLEQNGPIQVDIFHPYLETARLLGPEIYQWISLDMWVCEALYAAILFPEKRPEAEKVVKQSLKKAPAGINFDFAKVCDILADQLDRWSSRSTWEQYDLLGFSVCLNQLLPSLTALDAVKKNYPGLPVVMGGSSFPPEKSRAVFSLFPLDYLICGEGEQSLLKLCQDLAAGQQPERITTGKQLEDLGSLPMPDYDDYFREMKKTFGADAFIPVLPLEFSRGCWWGKCAFCNLNLQWQGFRAKSGEQMFAEATRLSEKYTCLDLAFTDNVLPVKESRIFFQKMAETARDIHFFAEIRASMRGRELLKARQGGLTSVQAGIEALSNSLLQRLNKGTSVIENLAVMKDAAAAGIILDGNLICEFPGSTIEEVEETLGNLDFVLPFHPLSSASFFLGHESPVDLVPRQYNICARTPHPGYKKLLPESVLHNLPLLIKAYRGDRLYQRKIWAPVKKKIKQWQQFHDHWQKQSSVPPLAYRDGGTFLVIRQLLPGQRPCYHRLYGTSRKIYLACAEIVSLAGLEQNFSGFSRKNLKAFLADLVKKRIMFCQDDRYLALAIQER